jgi:hypothetical protein
VKCEITNSKLVEPKVKLGNVHVYSVIAAYQSIHEKFNQKRLILTKELHLGDAFMQL